MLQLKTARQRAGMNQSDLAKTIGVSRSTVAMWESGASQPDIETILKLSQLLNITAGELIGESPVKTEQPTEYGELSAEKKALIDFALSLPEEKAKQVLRVLKAIVESDE